MIGIKKKDMLKASLQKFTDLNFYSIKYNCLRNYNDFYEEVL
jgi:hypothetical protein